MRGQRVDSSGTG